MTRIQTAADMEGMARLQPAGWSLAAIALLLLTMAYLREPLWGAGLSAAMLAELVTGREVAIPLALAAGVPPAWVAATSIAQNLAVAAIVVPLVAKSLAASAGRDSFAARFMRGLHDSAVERLPRGRSPWALFAFMLVPFIANGPVLAGIIGSLAGLPYRQMVPAIVAAVIITATAWTYAYDALTTALASIDDRLALVPAILAGGVALVWLVAATRRALQPGPATQA